MCEPAYADAAFDGDPAQPRYTNKKVKGSDESNWVYAVPVSVSLV